MIYYPCVRNPIKNIVNTPREIYQNDLALLFFNKTKSLGFILRLLPKYVIINNIFRFNRSSCWNRNERNKEK